MAAREYGADDGVVMSVQYLRVVLVLVSVPLVAPLLGGVESAAAPQPGAPVSEHLFTGAAVLLGLGLARLLPFAAAPVLWTLLVSALLALSGWFPHPDVPVWVLALGYTVVGANVGSSFTRERLRRLVRLFPLAVIQVLLGVGACAAIGVVFARAVGVSLLDGYLATTPGGLPAVVAVAVDSGDAIGLILTLQFVRVFLALACAPLIGWVLRRTA
jgi:membrane AbrB-like protein